MAVSRIPAVVRTRLGDDATFGLIELLDAEKKNWGEDVLSSATDRFERRLTQEVSTLRLEFHSGFETVRADIAASKTDILRWSFLFWIGQVAAMAAIVSLLLRAGGR